MSVTNFIKHKQRILLLSSPFYRWRTGGNFELLKVTELVTGVAKCEPFLALDPMPEYCTVMTKVTSVMSLTQLGR